MKKSFIRQSAPPLARMEVASTLVVGMSLVSQTFASDPAPAQIELSEALRVPEYAAPVDLTGIAGVGRTVTAVADLDKDGDLDLLLGLEDGTFSYFRNDGTKVAASFVADSITSLSAVDVGDRAAPAFADIDHDGDMDLIVGAASGALKFFRNEGDAFSPNFVEKTGADNPFDGLGVASNAVPAVGDVNNDNKLDVLVGAGDGTVTLLENTGTVIASEFSVQSAAGTLLLGEDFGDNAAPMLGDLDGDTDDDLVVLNEAGNARVYVNGRRGYEKGDTATFVLMDSGRFEMPAGTSPFKDFNFGTGAAGCLANLDADGDLDVLAGDSAGVLKVADGQKISKRVGIEANNLGLGSQGWMSPAYYFWDPPGHTANWTVQDRNEDWWYTRGSGDLTGDGLIDFVGLETSIDMSYHWRHSTSIYWRKADSWNWWGKGYAGTGSDGAVTEWIYSDIEYKNTITQDFIAEEFSFGEVQLVDFDCDGDLDLIVGCTRVSEHTKHDDKDIDRDHLGYFENTGDATWPVFVQRKGEDNPLKTIALTRGISFNPTMVDLDGDGDLDCVLGEKDSPSYGFTYWENTGTAAAPNFVNRQAGVMPHFPWNLKPKYHPQAHFADFDKDGDLDMVVNSMHYRPDHYQPSTMNYFPGRYRFYENVGDAANPRFGAAQRSNYRWNAQSGQGNPVNQLFSAAQQVWDGFLDDTHAGHHDTMERLTIDDFNYDGYPDVHWMLQHIPYSGFERTSREAIAPTGRITPSSDAPYYTTNVPLFQVKFDEAVGRLDIGDFTLTADGVEVDISSTAVLTGGRKNYTLDLSAFDWQEADYVLTLRSADSFVHDAFGNVLESDVSFSLSMIELDEDVAVSISGTAAARHSETVSYTIIAQNAGLVNSPNTSVAVDLSEWLYNLEIVSLTLEGGAVSSQSEGSLAGDFVDNVNLPAGSRIVYQIEGYLDVTSYQNSLAEKTGSTFVRITPAAEFDDEYLFNNVAGSNTIIYEKILRTGQVRDRGGLMDSAGFRAQDGKLADFNGDGFLDLIDSEYNVHLNNQNSGFSAPYYILGTHETEDYHGQFDVGDVNGDGFVDIVLADSAGIMGFAGSRVLTNDGTGNFTVSPYVDSAQKIFLVDMDNDGDLDWVASDHEYSGKSYILYNDGSGNFGNKLHLGNVRAHAVGDMNQDGFVDVVTDKGVYLQSSRKTFELAQVLDIAAGDFVELGDFNNDGYLDLVVGGVGNALYWNDGEGSLTDSGIEFPDRTATDIEVADLNADGLVDIYWISRGTFEAGDELYTGSFVDGGDVQFLSNGDGTFNEVSLYGDQPTAVVLGDLDNNASLDLLFFSQDATGLNSVTYSNRLRLLIDEVISDVAVVLDAPKTLKDGEEITFTLTAINNSSEIIPVAPISMKVVSWLSNVRLESVQSIERAVGSAVVGSDIAPDFTDTLAMPVGGQMVYTFSARVDVSDTAGAANYKYAAVIADIDIPSLIGDEIPSNNVIGISIPIEQPARYGGTMSNKDFYIEDSHIENVQLGDFDGDGNLDALVRRGTFMYSIVFNNDGKGEYNSYDLDLRGKLNQGFRNSRSAALGDVDNDGDLDILIADEEEVSVGWFGGSTLNSTLVLYNNGSGQFTYSDFLEEAQKVFLRDMNHDGFLDFVGNDFDDDAFYCLNQGDGTFGAKVMLGEFEVLDIADLNGDGDLDLVSKFGIYLQEGDLQFERSQNIRLVWKYAVACGDIDGDGDIDIATAGYEPRNIGERVDDADNNLIYLNNGFGKFTKSTQVLTDKIARDVKLADMNADGQLDVVLMVEGDLQIQGDYAYFLNAGDLIYHNQGDGEFGDPVSFGSQATNVAIGDINGSGSLDAVTVSHGFLGGAPKGGTLGRETFRVWYNDLAPTISLIGNQSPLLLSGETFVDAGATATDNEDGDLTASMTTSALINNDGEGGEDFDGGTGNEIVPIESPYENYYVEYSVTDSAGNTTTARRNVRVHYAPTADAGGGNGEMATTANTIQLDGSASSDPEQTLLSYQWSTVSAASTVTFDDATLAQPTVTGLVVGGSYTFQLIVTDSDGASSTAATVDVRVNSVPVANAGSDAVLQNTFVTLDARASSDAEGTAGLQYLWSCDDPSAIILHPTSPLTQAGGFSVSKTYTFTLTVTDADGAQSVATVNYYVNAPPVVNAGADQRVATGEVELTATATDSDGTIIHGKWRVYPSDGVQLIGATNYTLRATGLTEGVTYRFEFTAKDNHNKIVKDSANVYVNKAPNANAGSNQTGVENGATLNGTASGDDDGTIVSYLWTQVNGGTVNLTNSNQATANVSSLALETTYVFQLTVTDSDGVSSSAQVAIQTRARTGYEKWVQENLDPNSSNLGENDDATGSGIPNVIAFLTDTKPGDDKEVVSLDVEQENDLAVSFKRRSDAADLNAYIEYSFNLVDWDKAVHGVDGVTIVITEGAYGTDSNGVPIDKVSINIPKTGKQQIFTKLVVE